jgi:hypothetical protein
VNGPGDFRVVIRRDHFPYFTQGRGITSTGLDLYGSNVTAHRAAGDPSAATTALQDQEAFALTAAPDAQVLVRSKRTDVFLVLRYSL